jgi:hypothetical protein
MLKVSNLSRPLNFRKEEDLCLPWDPDPVVGLHLAPFAIVAGTAAAGKEPVVDEVDEVDDDEVAEEAGAVCRAAAAASCASVKCFCVCFVFPLTKSPLKNAV